MTELKLVDLPGITRNPIDDQPKNIEQITKNIARKYVEEPLIIILFFKAVNGDISIWDGLILAKEIDTSGSRAINELTKFDIMNADIEGKKINKEKYLIIMFLKLLI